MANLDATLWNDIQSSNATNEKRFSQLGVVDLAADSTAAIDFILPSDIERMNTLSSLRKPLFPVIKDQTVTVNSTPGFNFIPSNLPTTDQYTFVAYDVFSGLRHYPSAYANNSVDGQYALQQLMLNVAYAMGKAKEDILVTQLEARKTQVLSAGSLVAVSQGDGAYTFNTSTDTLTVTKAAQKETMFFNLSALMEANELGGNYRIVTTRGGLSVQKAEQLKYNVSNNKNLNALGMFPLDQMYETAAISQGSDVFSGFIVRDGSFGFIPNFPNDFFIGTSFGAHSWSISDMELPFIRSRANIYVNKEATNATSIVTTGTDSNLIMTHVQEMAIWDRFFVVYRYNSDLATRANDIVKVVGATS